MIKYHNGVYEILDDGDTYFIYLADNEVSKEVRKIFGHVEKT